MNTKTEKLVVAVNHSVGTLIAVVYTLKIDLSTVKPQFNDIFSLLVMLPITALLLGTPLWIVSQIIIECSAKGIKAKDHPDYLNASQSAFNAIGIATAYTMLLYLLGLTDTCLLMALLP